jgi:hypothetical protein
MTYPEYFNSIENIVLKDELAQTLGTFEDGIVEFSYLDVVKCAGHSCPTVAGAYISVLVGLKELYKDEIPIRGNIIVSFSDDQEDGVAGVIAAVVSNITGATEKYGFKGMNGKFARHSLMNFNSPIKGTMKLTRMDTNTSVELLYNPSQIDGQPFQKRVENIFANIDKVITII